MNLSFFFSRQIWFVLNRIKAGIVVFVFSIGAAESCHASILLETELTIDFTNPADAEAKASWSPADKLGITSEGLGRYESVSGNSGPWVETKPFPLGLSWRTASASSVTVTTDFSPKSGNPQTTYSYEGEVYVRYGPDTKNWSSWQALKRRTNEKSSGPDTGIVFEGQIGVPRHEREDYNSLVSEYSTLDVPWKSDEEAAVKWIVSKNPDFFKKNLSFVGYVEFLFESDFNEGHRLSKFRAEMGVGLGGLHSIPKDPNAEKNRFIPWRYRAP